MWLHCNQISPSSFGVVYHAQACFSLLQNVQSRPNTIWWLSTDKGHTKTFLLPHLAFVVLDMKMRHDKTVSSFPFL